jgi:hypothetical protein
MTRLALLVATFAVAACSRNIGDACQTNVDCAIDGTRFCDNAPPNGYCTVEGCDTGTCPTESVCIRFYTPNLEQPCHYDPCNAQGTTQYAADGVTPLADVPGTCAPDERCECDSTSDSDFASMTCPDTGQAGIMCQSGTAHCAPENSERRWCMYKCSHNSDCRRYYECRTTGTLGSEPVPDLEHAYGKPAKFCVSNGSQGQVNEQLPQPTTK